MNNCRNILSYTSRYIALACSLFILNQEIIAAEDISNLDSESLIIRAGAFIIRNADTSIGIKDKQTGVSVVIDLDQALDMDSSTDSPRLDIQYKFNPSHGIDFSWYPVYRRGERFLQEDIVIKDKIFPAGSNVKSFFDTVTYKLAYNYTLFNNDELKLDTKMGLNITSYNFGMKSEGVDIEEHFYVTAPLPTLGLALKYRLVNKLYIRTNWDLFFLQYENYAGSQTEMSIALEHQTFKNFGVGAGINKYFLKLGADEDAFVGTIENSYTGYLVYLIYKY